MSEKELRIGIETELYLDPVDPTFNEKHRIFTPESLNDLAKDLVKSYNEQKEEPSTLACVTRIDDTEYEFGDEPEDSTGRPFWSVMSDITIWRSDKFDLPKEQRWPLELTSPILSYKASGHWRREVSEHFETLKVFANIDVNKSCGMHIHISPPLGTPWKISEVKKISMSALYFENAFEAILPKGRRGNQFARSNKLDNYLFKDLNLDQCFEWIRNSTHMKSLVWLLNPWDDGEASPARNTFPSLNTAINDRFYGWNFGNLGYSEPVLGTIEFRRAPGVTTASSCISWADFIVSFIQAAIAGGLPSNLKNFAQTTDGLKKFMDGKWLGGTTASEHADIIFQLATKPAVEPISVKLSFEQIELLRGDANDDKKMSLLMAKLMKLEEKRKKAAGKA